MTVLDNLFIALKNTGISEVPVDILNISSNAEQAVNLLEKITKGEIKDLEALASYLKENIHTGLQVITEHVIPSDGIIDVQTDQIKTVSLSEAEKMFRTVIDDINDDQSEKNEDARDSDNTQNVNIKKDVTDKTASLWQYKPVPDDEPEPFDEYKTSQTESSAAEIIGARVRGKKHKHDGTNCDDWFEYETTDKWSIAAVSDGAGSKKFSRIGAMESCKAAVSYMKQQLEKMDDDIIKKISMPLTDSGFMDGCGYIANIVQDAVDKAYLAVEEAFESRKSKYDYLKVIDRDMEFKDFSGTLLLCIIIPVKIDDHKENFVAACQIGDGIICSVDRDAPLESALKLLGDPDGGKYAGETDFLTSKSMRCKENLMKKTKIMRGKNSNVLLMTDGVADDYFPNSPQLLRLVLDLELNGILKTPERSDEKGAASDSIPEPVCYPWVNDNQKLIAVQYASKLLEVFNCTLDQLWNNNSLLCLASLESFGTELPEKSSERLQRWLDNYVERGSFDDRTLLIINTSVK